MSHMKRNSPDASCTLSARMHVTQVSVVRARGRACACGTGRQSGHDEDDVSGEAAPEGAVAAEGCGAERVGDLVLVQPCSELTRQHRTHARAAVCGGCVCVSVPAMNWAMPP